ncbi:3D domain-containing protein [Gaetbulibacter saemankumensis]|uniref:3D domain-containing protein n=1 Tax=Gaetbulibacter saemankumensis TaxID=311208 RepID=UPI001FE16447|nr:3D domain-containing protein [Gaetbulibacter saemankumensis]
MKLIVVFLSMMILMGCKLSIDTFEDQYNWYELKVTATAYNSLAYQTNSNPNITAFGDSLTSNTKCIAISRDLQKLGLSHNTPVKMEGFDSIYFVKDKMNSRWKNRIDIYMGKDVKAAKAWGRQKINIWYGIKKDSIELE